MTGEPTPGPAEARDRPGSYDDRPGPRRPRRHRRRKADRSSRHDPEPIGGVVGAVLDRCGVRDEVERAHTASRWDEIVGPHIARVTRGARVSGNTLFVEVEGAAWMTELSMMRRDLMRRLNAGRDSGRIEKIVFLQAEGRGKRGGDNASTRGRS